MDNTAKLPEVTQTAPQNVKGGGWWHSKAMRRFRRNPLGIVGTLILLFFLIVAVFSPQFTSFQLINYRNTCVRDLGLSASTVSNIRNPLTPTFWRSIVAPPGSCYRIPRASFSQTPTPPTYTAVMGTTSGGYDIYYGLVWGTRTAFISALVVTSFGLIVGIVIGSIAGYFGGWIDNLLMRVIDVIFAIPGLILAMVIVTILGQSLTNVIIALMIFSWAGYARFLRGEVLRVRELDFVDGARALGARSPRLIFKYVLPNSIGSLLILASLDIGSVVLSVAALNFLGLGAPPGFADWGQMINFARGWMTGLPGQPFAYWYVIFWPSFIILLFVLGWNLLGDAVRDVLDVRS